MNYDQIRATAIELCDKHTDKFLYMLEKPQFVCWFVGRIQSIYNRKADTNMIKTVMWELAHAK